MSNDNDKIINAGHRFGGPTVPPMGPPEVKKLTLTLYRIYFKNNISEPKEITGYLGVSPLFIAITDSEEKILFMFPHGDYSYVEAIIPEVDLDLEGDSDSDDDLFSEEYDEDILSSDEFEVLDETP